MSKVVVLPVSSKSFYEENDIVDFLLTFENSEIVMNSIRVSGQVKVNTTTDFDTAQLDNSQDVKIDSTVGIAGAFQSITCSCDKVGVIENQNEHPRYIKAKTAATVTPEQLLTDIEYTTELRNADDDFSRFLLGGSGEKGGNNRVPFSFRPDIALNKSSDNIPFSKTGAIKLSLRLATNNQFIYGDDAANYKFQLYDLRVEYLVKNQSSSGNLTMETIHMIKQTAESNNTSISTRVPASVTSISMVFHPDSELDQAKHNHLELSVPPDVQRVEFSFNDTTTAYHTFALETQEEILYNYQQSWGVKPMTKSNIVLPALHRNESYGIGMPLGSYLDLSMNKIGVNILSNIRSDRKYGIFMYFRGIARI